MMKKTVTIAALLLASLFALRSAQAQTRIGPAPPVTYDNKYELYGGLNFMNFMAGQELTRRMDFGGGEIEGTYWVKPNWGLAAEYRGEAGTTPVYPGAFVYGVHRPLVYMNMVLFGVQYRWVKNQHAALDFHAYGGPSYGVFDGGTAGAPPGNAQFTPSQIAYRIGLYSNHTAPIIALGGSIDMNRSKNWAVRLSPDLILDEFGSDTREFFAISGGVVYRLPVKKKK
ncbi:MAG: hypothetical protein ACLQM6_06795 [Acidobacteriaceae bacterium]